MPPTLQRYLAVVIRVGIFAVLARLGMFLFAYLFYPGGYFVAATLSVFAASAVANAVCLRIYESGRLPAIGLGWNRASSRNLLIGIAGGAGSALLVLVVPLASGMARMDAIPETPLRWPSLLFVLALLLFGAAGEEMLFHGYGFQVLLNALGPFGTILPVSVLFGLLHAANQNASIQSVANTVLWGVVFGYAFLRSRDLWLPIGLHFGWNAVLPLFGANLSGFTMGVTGYSIHWNISALWSGGDYGPEGGLLTTVVVVVLFIYLRKAPVARQSSALVQLED